MLGDMVDHVCDNSAHMRVGGDVMHFAPMALGADQPSGLEQPKMMAHQRWRQAVRHSNPSDRQWRIKATGKDTKTRRITEQVKGARNLCRLILC